jgi:predicted SAM-dependent methyltransferase
MRHRRSPEQQIVSVLRRGIGRALNAVPVTPLLRELIRDEIRAAWVRAGNRVIPSRRQRIRRIRRTPGQLVNVACGPQVLSGFLNLDANDRIPGVTPWDCRRALPLDEGAAAGIRVEHFVEHLEPREELPRFLEAAHRALQPGGVLRVVVPDAGRYLEAYCRPDLTGFTALSVPDPFPHDLPTRMDVVNHVFHQWSEHRWGYDFETLADRLRRAGFRTVTRTAYQHSLDPRLACDRSVHAPYSLYVDAQK